MAAPPTAEQIREVNTRYHDVAASEYDAKWGIDFGDIGRAQVLGKVRKLLGRNPGPFADSAAGNVLKTNLSGAGRPNPYCADSKAQDPDPTENAQSVSSYVTFGKFRIVHMGDLTYNKELDLMCPNNRLGNADLFVVSHHGQAISNSPALVHALNPRAAIINNGTRKGGQPDAMRVLFSSPGLEDVWEMHFSLLSGQEYTVPGAFIANQIDQQSDAMPIGTWTPPLPGQQAPAAPTHNGKSNYFKIVAQQDGTFSITNTRNNFSKTYRPAGSNSTR